MIRYPLKGVWTYIKVSKSHAHVLIVKDPNRNKNHKMVVRLNLATHAVTPKRQEKGWN